MDLLWGRQNIILVYLVFEMFLFKGSYAGARAAHMKVLYPDIVWGAIASSGMRFKLTLKMFIKHIYLRCNTCVFAELGIHGDYS